MNAYRHLLLILLAGCVLITVACSPRNAEPSATLPLSDILDQDLRKLDEPSASAAQHRVQTLRGETTAPMTALRLWQLGDHYLLVAEQPDTAGQLVIELLGSNGPRWQRPVHLDSQWSITALALGSSNEVEPPVLVVDCQPPAKGSGQVRRLYFTMSSSRALLVRAVDQDRQLANHRLSEEHPHLQLDNGDISSDDSALQLAATVALAQPAAQEQRGQARVIGHLERLASSTNRWLAEAAALALTRPR